MEKIEILFIGCILLSFMGATAQNSEDSIPSKRIIKTKTTFAYYLTDTLGKLEKKGLGSVKIMNYDENSKPIDELTYNSDSTLVNKTSFGYDRKGRIEYMLKYRSDGTTYQSTVYLYKKGIMIEEAIFDKDKSGFNTVSKRCIKYDNKGRISEESFYFPPESLLFYYISNYDTCANIIEKATYAANGNLLLFKSLYVYDKNRNILEEKKYDYNDSLVSFESNTYDERGNLIENHYVDKKKQFDDKYILKYISFDSDGDWKEKVVYKNNKPETIEIREFRYY